LCRRQINANVGAHARSGPLLRDVRLAGATSYGCTLNTYGTFSLPLSLGPDPFSLVIHRTDAAMTELSFDCTVLDRSTLAAQSEDSELSP
jgi:hypothetical protein